MEATIYFLGHEWEVKRVTADALPIDALCVSEWQKLTIKILGTLSPAVFEEVLLHEAIELSVLNYRIVENIKETNRSLQDDADYIAECLDSIVQETIRRNPEWFPITRGVNVVRAPSRDRVPKNSLDTSGVPSSTP